MMSVMLGYMMFAKYHYIVIFVNMLIICNLAYVYVSVRHVGLGQ